MKLRVKFNRVDNSVTQINYTALSLLEVRVDGVLQTVVPDGLYALYNIPFTCISDSKNLYIKCQDGSNLIYENTFKIYGYDLGNNGTTSNPDFEINLVDYSVVSSSFVYASLIAYRNPNNYEIYYYDSNNSYGTKYYRIVENNITLFTDSLEGFYVNKNNVQVYQDIFFYQNNVLVNSMTSIDVNIQPSILYPNSDLYISSNLDCYNECYSLDSQLKAAMYFDFNNINTYYVDDVLEYMLKTLFIRYELLDYAGYVLSYQDKNINITNPVYQFVAGSLDNSPIPQPNDFDFNFSYFGDYVVRVIYQLGNACKTFIQCFKNKTVKACNYFTLKETDKCGVYELLNASFDTIALNIYKLNDKKEFDFINTYYLLSGETLTNLTYTDGVYKFSVVRNGIESSTIKIVYCQAENCIKDLMYKVILDNCCDKCDDKDISKINRLLISTTIFLALIKDYHSYNTGFYTEFTKTQIEDIYTISDVLNRINEYCYECQDVKIDNISIVKSYKNNDCGCNK